ncbi:MAG: hypothetical protein ACK4S4_14945 [Pyrinomonadaceae bacterium]
MAVNNTLDIRRFERRLFWSAAILFPLIVAAGFARTYYLKAVFGTPALPSLMVHLHGIAMSAWVLLFIGQVWLISSKRIRVHQRLGWVGIGLAAVVVVTGAFVAVAAGRSGSASFPPDIPRLSFMIVPLADLLVFVLLVGAAVYYRKKPASHKRLMLLTAINFLPPALARIGFLAPFGPLAFFGIPAALAVAAVALDRWRTGKFNTVFVVASVLSIATYPLRLIVSTTDAWLRFAAWLTS